MYNFWEDNDIEDSIEQLDEAFSSSVLVAELHIRCKCLRFFLKRCLYPTQKCLGNIVSEIYSKFLPVKQVTCIL